MISTQKLKNLVPIASNSCKNSTRKIMFRVEEKQMDLKCQRGSCKNLFELKQFDKRQNSEILRQEMLRNTPDNILELVKTHENTAKT